MSEARWVAKSSCVVLHCKPPANDKSDKIRILLFLQNFGVVFNFPFPGANVQSAYNVYLTALKSRTLIFLVQERGATQHIQDVSAETEQKGSEKMYESHGTNDLCRIPHCHEIYLMRCVAV